MIDDLFEILLPFIYKYSMLYILHSKNTESLKVVDIIMVLFINNPKMDDE